MSEKLQKVRNFGIAAHIDAGKTTTSERILKFTGEIHKIGEVHDGGATMDFMKQEKARGITIQSASTQCEWDYYNPITNKKDNIIINLIDTPGHIDFTIEVERALRVLDGVVIVLEGVGGVQPQTLTVWRQKNKYKLSTIIFINKMDRMGANFEYVLNSIDKKLDKTVIINGKEEEARPIILNIPVGEESNFSGVIDLIKMEYYQWEEGKIEFKTLEVPLDYKEKAENYRKKLIDELSNISEEILTLLFEEKEVPLSLIYKTLRDGIVGRKLVAVLCGASFKNKGVQQLLDAIATYLPAPNERGAFTGTSYNKKEVNIERIADDKSEFSGFVFKIVPLPNLGELTLTRIFSGTINSGDMIINTHTGKKEKIGRIYIIKANKHEEVKTASTGDIVAFQGLKNITNGITLCGEKDPNPIVYDQMTYPLPVISQKIIPETKHDEEKLGSALQKLSREDPSFIVASDPETNETTISGMGSLHLEIKETLLRDDFGIKFKVLPPTVNYRETPKSSGEIDHELKKQTGGAGQYARMTLLINRYTAEEITKMKTENNLTDEEAAAIRTKVDFKSVIVGTCIDKKFVPSIEEGIKDSCRNAGPLGRYPVQDCYFTLTTGNQHSVDSNSHAFYQCAVTATRELMKKVGSILLEPIMQVFVYVPIEYMGNIMGDLSSRDGIIITTTTNGNNVNIEAEVPLRRMMEYIDDLRASTKGEGSYEMVFVRYGAVPEHAVPSIVKSRENVHYKS
jgi:elongation factor G